MKSKKTTCYECGKVESESPLGGPDGRWKCPGCKHVFHFFCSGAADDMPDVCDNCWAEEHKGDAAGEVEAVPT